MKKVANKIKSGGHAIMLAWIIFNNEIGIIIIVAIPWVPSFLISQLLFL